MTAVTIAERFGRERLALLADWLAAGVAVALPWSTSATAILIVAWLLALLPTLDVATVRREIGTAAGGLPVLLWCLAAIGLLWADVSWAERIGGLGGFHRLLIIPLLLAHFRRSEHGIWVLYGFLASATAVMLVSWILVLTPGLPWRGKTPGIPVRDYMFQSTACLICAFALIVQACGCARSRAWRATFGLAALAALFIANITFIATGRTILVVAPVLVLFLGWQQFGWKGMLGAAFCGAVVASALWFGSSYLRERVTRTIAEFQDYRATDAMNSTGLHLEFLKKSWTIVATAPIIGHGTGSIPDQFRRAAVGKTGAASVASVNPHNQYFAVAIQLGLVGIAVLLAMWAAHFLLFRGPGLIAWIGTVIVVQNVVSSLFNSHLFDFAHGWLYVFGVGVVGGMTLRQGSVAPAVRPVTER